MAMNVALNKELDDMAKTGNRPVHEIRLGRIKAAIWENKVDDVTRHNVTISRIYKDDKNQWARSDSFGRDDLLLVAKVADLANSWIHAQSDGANGSEEDIHF
jgi:hypothetical protein